MVTPEFSERRRPHKFMETAPKRSKPLHNFSLPSLKWGNQQFLRCMKVDSNGERIASPDLNKHSVSEVQTEKKGLIITHKDFESEKRRSPNGVSNKKVIGVSSSDGGGGVKSKIQTGGGDDGIEEIRAKLMVHLRTAAHKMKFDIPEEREVDKEEQEESALAEAAKPWNLRKRRAACNAPTTVNGKVGGGGGERGGSRNEEQPKLNPLTIRTENPTMKSLRLRGGLSMDQSREKERRKFSIPLSRKEIEEDFLAMLGSKPSRRPTKRPKIVQKQVDAVFPGLWLTEVTVDAYRVPDFIDSGKR